MVGFSGVFRAMGGEDKRYMDVLASSRRFRRSVPRKANHTIQSSVFSTTFRTPHHSFQMTASVVNLSVEILFFSKVIQDAI